MTYSLIMKNGDTQTTLSSSSLSAASKQTSELNQFSTGLNTAGRRPRHGSYD